MPDPTPHPSRAPLPVIEVDPPWWRRPLFLVPLVLVAICLVGGALGARPAWRAIKQRRANTHLVQGERLFEEGKFAKAIDQGRLALQLVPGSPRALRLMAESLSKLGARSGLDYWQQLLASPEGTVADREAYADLALGEGLLTVASNEIARLNASPSPTPRSRLLGIRFQLQRNDTNAALALARDLLRIDAANPTNGLAVATLLHTRPDWESREEARDIFWRVATNSPAYRLDAWEYLVRGPAGRREDRERIATELAGLSALGTRERILLAETRMILDPSTSRATATEALDAMEPRSDVERLGIVLWLHRFQLYELSIPILAPNHVRQKPALFRARIDALVATGRMQTAYRELLDDNATLDPFESETLRYRAATALKDDPGAQRHRDQLLRAAGRDPGRIRRVAEFAERNKLNELAIEAWKRLAEDRFESRRALHALAALADQAGDTWAARDAIRRGLKQDPKDSRLLLRAAHYDLLLGEDPARVLKTIEPLADDATLGAEARFIIALAHLRAGDHERALRSIQGTVYPGGPMPNTFRVIVAAVAGANGDSNRAAEISRSLPIAQLRPEERELVRPYLVMPRGAPTDPAPAPGPSSP